MSVVSLLIALVIICLAWWAVNAIMRATGLADPVATIVRVIFVVLVVIWLLSAFTGYGPMIHLR